MKRIIPLFLGTIAIFLSACSTKQLSPNEVNEKTWTENITQGGIFSPSFNFTLNRELYEDGKLVSTGIIKNDNGVIHINVPEEIDNYYEITSSDSFYYYYEDTEEGWVKENHNSLDTLLVDVLDYTILYPFEYQAFTYDTEGMFYFVNNYDSSRYSGKKEDEAEKATFDYVEFKFLNNNVTEFKAIKDNVTVHLTASNYNQTEVTLPSAEELDYSNPYWYTKHKIENITVEEAEYESIIRNELSDAYLYVVGDDDYTSAQMVNFVSKDLVFVYYGTAKQYKRQNKSFEIEFGKRMGFGKDYEEYDDSYRYQVITVDSTVIDNRIDSIFHIPNGGGKDVETVDVHASALLTNKEIIEEEYEYKDAKDQLIERLDEKRINITNVTNTGEEEKPDLINNGYIVIDFDANSNNYAEIYLNSDLVLFGYPLMFQYTDDRFDIQINGKYDISKDELCYFTSASVSAELIDDIFITYINFSINGINYSYRTKLEITNITTALAYKSFMDHRYEVDKANWNKYFNNPSIIENGFSCSYTKTNGNRLVEDYSISYANNIMRERVFNPDTHDETTRYYEFISDEKAYVYSCSDNSGWNKTLIDFTVNNILSMCKLNYSYSYDDAVLTDYTEYKINNDEEYENITLAFNYTTLSYINRKIRNTDIIEGMSYSFNDAIDIELPPLS